MNINTQDLIEVTYEQGCVVLEGNASSLTRGNIGHFSEQFRGIRTWG